MITFSFPPWNLLQNLSPPLGKGTPAPSLQGPPECSQQSIQSTRGFRKEPLSFSAFLRFLTSREPFPGRKAFQCGASQAMKVKLTRHLQAGVPTERSGWKKTHKVQLCKKPWQELVGDTRPWSLRKRRGVQRKASEYSHADVAWEKKKTAQTGLKECVGQAMTEGRGGGNTDVWARDGRFWTWARRKGQGARIPGEGRGREGLDAGSPVIGGGTARSSLETKDCNPPPQHGGRKSPSRAGVFNGKTKAPILAEGDSGRWREEGSREERD